MTDQQPAGAWGVGLATTSADGDVLDTRFPAPALGAPPNAAEPGTAELHAHEAAQLGAQLLSESAGHDELRRVSMTVVLTVIPDLAQPPGDAHDAYLRLHLLSHRLVAPRAVTPFATRFGLKATLILGCLVMALQYPLTAAVDGMGVWLVARCLASGIGEAFYWTSFHAYFASVGDSEHRGRQIGAREALAAGIGVVAPLF